MLAKIAAFTEAPSARQELWYPTRSRAAKANDKGSRSHGLPGGARTAHSSMRSGARANARRHGRARHFAFQTAGLDRRAECQIALRVRISPSPTAYIRSDLAEEPDDWREWIGQLGARKRNHRGTGDARRRPLIREARKPITGSS